VNSSLQSKEIKGRKFKSILCISDQHFPYQHRDTVPFLKALNDKYAFDLVVNMGDEVDNHAISFHDSDPNLMSPGDELERAIKELQPVYKLFPKVEVIDSNHGSLAFRKGKNAMLPDQVFKSPRDILRAPKGWNWNKDLIVDTEMGKVYFHHGKSGTAGKLSKNMSLNAVQGHHHSVFQVTYWGSPVGLFFDMHVGCLVDDNSLALAYNKTTLQRPVIGLGVIINGRPQLVPMHLTRGGKWTGRL
jgi:hypothetical protein